MTVRAVTMYEAEDGKQFRSITQARRHDRVSKLMASIKANLQEADRGGSAFITLTNNEALATKMRDDLNKVLRYHRDKRAATS